MTVDRNAPRIAELPELVRNQIAAGEVIERPASAVKELIENSLDAGAEHIRIDLEAGGTKLIRVTDDGGGMGPRDLELSFLSHATSKLRDAADLEHIASLGFRGEALASIGSIARCRIFSRRPGEEIGWQIENEGGRITEPREAGGAQGTVIEIRDLFFNTPARRRFLKTDSTELTRSQEWIQRMALANPGVGFVATHNQKRLYDIEAGMDLRARVRRTFSAELADSLIPVHAEEGDTVLSGLLAPPSFAQRTTAKQMWFLNGRFLRDRVLIRCLADAFHGLIDGGRHPIAFLNLSMNPSQVDVNVHPTKSEVRFRDSRRVFGFLRKALREAALTTDASSPGDHMLGALEKRGDWQPADPMLNQRELPDPIAGGSEPEQEGLVVRELPGSPEASLSVPHSSGAPAPIQDLPSAAESAWALRDERKGPFLVIDQTYILRALPDGFEIVDQHALHERLTFEGLKKDLEAGQLELQRFLVPELIELDRADVTLVEKHASLLQSVGIDVSVFGETTVAVQGLPARFRNPKAEDVLSGALHSLRTRGGQLSKVDLLEDVLHSAACRSSVMAGDELDTSEIEALLNRAAAMGNDQTCPHGRPTRVRFTNSDLERAFHRK
ncbi:MAG: DNA mismatch repair protein MutL [Planctomycetota bacterium]|jgi:DNA mismatch repair protein MutL